MGAAERAEAAPAPHHPLVGRVLDPATPEALRLNAARGALPIPGADLVYLQVRLVADPAPAVAAAALDSLGRLTPDTLAPVLRDARCAPEVLDHFARGGSLAPDLLAAVVAHPAIADATLETLAETGDAETLNLIVTNEVRVIASPGLLARLRASPKLSPDNRRRLAELERDFIGKDPIRLAGAAAPRPAAGTGTGAAAGPAAAATGTGATAGAAAATGAAPAAPGEEYFPEPGVDEAPPGVESEGDVPPFDPAAEQRAEEELLNSDAFQRIMRLNVAERNLLAMKGGMEERAILIRDTAKVVSLAVLKNPRLSENEIAKFAGMRNLHEDILRAIGKNRDWTKTYGVALRLVRNPKTPQGLSVQFLARLGTRDLRIISGDKNVPELVRRNARNMFLARTQPAKKSFKKAH